MDLCTFYNMRPIYLLFSLQNFMIFLMVPSFQKCRLCSLVDILKNQMRGEGFEPANSLRADLESASVGHLDTLAKILVHIGYGF